MDFCFTDGFSEPSLVIFPDGEMLCALRTGSNKPLYCVRSYDRGHTWFLSETLFATPSISWAGIYSTSHCNNSMITVDDNTLLYVHDALRQDTSAPNAWLQHAGHGLVIARRIEVHA